MTTGVQFTATIGPGVTNRWFTWGWPASQHIIWHVMPVTPRSGAPELDWDVAVERATSTQCTYWITVKNLTTVPVAFEGRFAVLS